MNQDTIDRLKDDSEYYGDFGKQYLSNSDIGTLLKNPTEFRKPQDDNVNFHKGRYFHQLILEPEKANETKFVEVSSRNTKAYKEQATNGIIMLDKEGQEIRDCVQAMMGNLPFFEGIRSEGVQYEVPSIKLIKGMLWKGKADIVCKDKLIDLKTTSNIADFKWSARKYNYDSQCYIYQQLFGLPLEFYVVDKTNMQLGIYRPSEEFLQRGEEKVERAISVYKKFFQEDSKFDINEYYVEDIL
jgi:hypothetical protein|tara:strand:- start:42035 stop:42760 length:726 start_codon:yes stop_codon:yes gene_type:complete